MKKLMFHAVIALSLFSFAVACGKKKSDTTPVRAGGKASPNKDSNIPTPDAETGDVQAKAETDDSVQGDENTGTNLDTLPDSQVPQAQTPAPGTTAAPQSAQDTQSKGTVEDIVHAPQATATDLKFMAAEGRKYAGTADDYLRNYLMYKTQQVSDAAQAELNLKSANSIRSATLKIDYRDANSEGTGDVAMTLVVGTSSKDEKKVVLGGAIENQKARLRSSSSSVSGKLTCMDRDVRFCENAMVELTIGSAKKSTVYAIMRRTNIQITGKFPAENCKTQDCENMLALLRHTELGMVDQFSIKKAKMESFEIINGRTAFKVNLQTRGQEVIVFGGVLLNPETHPLVNVTADRSLAIEDQVNFETGENFRTRMNDSLKDIRIVENDGKGMIRLNANFKEVSPGLRDHMQLIIKRIGKELRPIVE